MLKNALRRQPFLPRGARWHTGTNCPKVGGSNSGNSAGESGDAIFYLYGAEGCYDTSLANFVSIADSMVGYPDGVPETVLLRCNNGVWMYEGGDGLTSNAVHNFYCFWRRQYPSPWKMNAINYTLGWMKIGRCFFFNKILLKLCTFKRSVFCC